MSSFRPIAGNESFKLVENVAGAVKNLDLSEGKIDSVSAGTLNLVGVGLTDAGSQAGRGVLYRAVGYTPAISQIAVDQTVFLNKRPNVGLQLTSGLGANVNSELLLLPTGAIVQKVTIINNTRTSAGALEGLTAAGQMSVGVGDATQATLAVTGGGAELKLADGGDVAAINAFPLVTVAAAGVAAAEVLGGTGIAPSASTVEITSTTNGVTITGVTSALSASATAISTTNPTQGFHLVVVIDYLMPGTGTVPGPVASGRWDTDASAVVP